MNEKAALDGSRDKHKPRGRAISLCEIVQSMLGYPEVMTDLVFGIFLHNHLNFVLVWRL